MAAAMWQALPSFSSEYCQKSLFISVSSDFYKKCKVTNNFCVSTHNSYCSLENCKFHILLIGSSFDQILQRLSNFHYHAKLSIVFTLCTNTDYIRMLFHQLAKFSINLTALFTTISIGNEQKNAKCCKEKTVTQKIQMSLFVFQPETSFHTNYWFSFSRRSS